MKTKVVKRQPTTSAPLATGPDVASPDITALTDAVYRALGDLHSPFLGETSEVVSDPAKLDGLIELCGVGMYTLEIAMWTLRRCSGVDARVDAKCWEMLANSILTAVRIMNEAASRNPEHFRGEAGGMQSWPMERTLHAELAEHLPGDELLRSIGLGSTMPGTFDGARWKSTGMLAVIAQGYLRGFAEVRELVRKHGLSRKRDFERASYAVYQCCPWMNHIQPTKELLLDISRLDDFGVDTWPAWADVAEKRLGQHFSNPVDGPRLRALVTAPSKLKSKGRWQTHLRQQLRNRIAGIAGARKF